MNTINKRVWKAIGHNYILFGTIVEEKKTNGWALVRVEWTQPHHDAPMADEWQKLVNLGYVEDLVKERFLNESR
tara:strand:+ start:72 stop:293 length:222 start_codon:yes stop_codon:yes gene_type:complete